MVSWLSVSHRFRVDNPKDTCTIFMYKFSGPMKGAMPTEISYSQARKQFASLLDQVTQNKEMIIIRRRGGEPAALVSADELASLTETVHLLRSPANAERLLAALERAMKDEGDLMSTDQLADQVGLDR